jgi:predicted nucleotidyltransferase
VVTIHEIRQAAGRIAQRFKPQRIILFGSYAYGIPNQNSDVDLLILLNGRNVHDEALRIREAIDFAFPIDLLVRSPQEFERRIGWGDFFLKEVQEKGRVLYEAPDARVGDKSRRRLRHRAA